MGLQISKQFLLPLEEMNPKPSLILPRAEVNSEASVLLPEDIIEEILSRLPAKSLLIFRCVSKSWRSLIGSKVFIQKHLQNIKKFKTYAYWGVLYNCTEHGLKQCPMQSYIDDPSIVPSAIDDPKNNHLMTDCTVLGHCNGLLSILIEPGCFFLWNPTTRISIELPRIELSVTRKYGFGWDEGTDAYKVFALVSDQGKNVGKVYSTQTNSWKTVDHGCLSLLSDRQYGKFANGKIHWLKESGHQIETFDLNSEVFGMIDQPFKPEVSESMWLYEETDGCLGVACQSTNNNKTHWRLWVMNQCGEKKSWVKRIATKDDKFTCCEAAYFYIESLVSPVI